MICGAYAAYAACTQWKNERRCSNSWMLLSQAGDRHELLRSRIHESGVEVHDGIGLKISPGVDEA
jgi:hypothetical protein